MSIYAAVEFTVVALIALVSLFYVTKAFIPGPMRKVRVRVADWLSRTVHHDSRLNLLAARLRVGGPSSGCATGCDSGCNGCDIAARAQPQSAGDDTRRR
jgi:hypothetical protein